MTNEEWMKLPYELRRYIENEHSAIGSNNQCDHRPTYQSELDSATERLVRLYDAGVKFVESIGTKEAVRCRKYLLARGADPYRVDKLVVDKVCSTWMLVKLHITHIETMRKVREAVT